MSEKRIFAYAMELSARMDFAESVRRELAQAQDGEEIEAAARDTIDRYVFYLVSGQIPSVEPVWFCRVPDSTAVRRLFEADLKNEGDGSGVIIDRDNDSFIVEKAL